MPQRLLVLFAETPVHAGGSESVGVVDLPIQRETATGLPVIWGQSLKGALRDAAHHDPGWSLPEEKAVFGSAPPGSTDATEEADEGDGSGTLTRGGVSIGDAQLLLFPAATLTKTFAWVTSPMLLARLARKTALATVEHGDTLSLRQNPDNAILAGADWSGRHVVGPFVQTVRPHEGIPAMGRLLGSLAFPTGEVFDYARTKLTTDLLVVNDTVLSGLAETGTEVVARVQLDTNTKTVANGPFYSEYLPAETVLVALLNGPDEHLKKLTVLLDGKPLQLGGDETIGKGVLWCRVHAAHTFTESTQPVPPSTSAAAARPSSGGKPSPASIRSRTDR
jgi:CRISPR-associated protein Cmr4